MQFRMRDRFCVSGIVLVGAILDMMQESSIHDRYDALVREFLAAPFGEHSPALRQLMLRLRSLDAMNKHVLVEIEPYKKWRLAKLGPRNSAPVLLDQTFDDLEAAERYVFLSRIKMLKEGRL
ncbi:MAG: hypothetical protein JSS22_14835 [Proteobacteria bacterium]|nr:hypothetical protein [Pseudomonadota bacterium]